MIPSAFLASVSSGLFVCECVCVRSPQERAVKGTGVWISTCVAGAGDGGVGVGGTERLFLQKPSYLARCRHGGPRRGGGRGGSCGGYRTDGQTAGSDLVVRNRSEYPNCRN